MSLESKKNDVSTHSFSLFLQDSKAKGQQHSHSFTHTHTHKTHAQAEDGKVKGIQELEKLKKQERTKEQELKRWFQNQDKGEEQHQGEGSKDQEQHKGESSKDWGQ
jgi:hypothetical protein